MTQPEHRRAQLAALRHLLDDLFEQARAATQSALVLRNSAVVADQHNDLDEIAVRCSALGNAVRIGIIRLNKHLPSYEGEATHQPISPS